MRRKNCLDRESMLVILRDDPVVPVHRLDLKLEAYRGIENVASVRNKRVHGCHVSINGSGHVESFVKKPRNRYWKWTAKRHYGFPIGGIPGAPCGTRGEACCKGSMNFS